MRFTILTALATLAGSAAAGVIGAQAGGAIGATGNVAGQLVGQSGSGSVVAGAQVVVQIQTMGNISASLLQPAQQLSITNAPELLLGSGPWAEIILGFGKLVTTITGYVATLVGAKVQFDINVSEEIGLAFQLFVSVFSNLLEILIGKATFLIEIPFVGLPVAAVLRGVESIIDEIFSIIISLVSGPVAISMQSNLGSLDGTMQKAVTCYS